MRLRKRPKKAADKAEKAIAGKNARSRKRKRPTAEHAPEPTAKVRQMSDVSELVGLQIGWWSEEQEQVAPVARMI